MTEQLFKPTLACRLRNAPAAFLDPDHLEKLAKQVENGHFDEAIEMLTKDAEVHATADNYLKGEHIMNLRNDLMRLRSESFSPDVDEFRIEQVSVQHPTAGFVIRLVVTEATDIDEFKRQGYSINQDEDGIFAERQIPGKWSICSRCKGHGKHEHPAFSDGITSSEWNGPDWSEEDKETYLSGGYDVRCEECKGDGKVFDYDEEALKPFEERIQREYDEHIAACDRMSAAERRFGA